MSALEATSQDNMRANPRGRRVRLGRAEPLVWIAPGLVLIVFVFGYSLVDVIRRAFLIEGKWSGLENFRLVLTDPTFRDALAHNGRLLLAVPILVCSALFLSLLLFEGLRGWRFHRAMVFLPYVLPVPVVGVIFGEMLQLNGPFNAGLRSVGIGGIAVDWLGQPRWALWTVTGVIIWKELGLGVMLFLARLLSLPADTFEAARVDGARFFRLHRYVTVPQLGGVIAFYVVIEAITMVSWVFNYVYVLTSGQGGPGNATIVSELYIYQQAFQYNAVSLAAAAAVILFVAALCLIVVFFYIQRRALGRDRE
jgi:ABC-type sugar transport system permease subunit